MIGLPFSFEGELPWLLISFSLLSWFICVLKYAKVHALTAAMPLDFSIADGSIDLTRNSDAERSLGRARAMQNYGLVQL